MNTDKNNTQLPQSSVSVSVADLRIGNYVNYIVNNKIEIQLTSKIISAFLADWKDGELKSIPLTEEWLLKFGFITGGAKNWLFISLNNIDTAYLYFNPNGKGIAIEENDKECSFPIKIEYVHQLQNLYHALTGSELQISSITEH